MRTTIRINDGLLLQAKKRAAEEGRTLTSLIEEALTLIMAKPKAGRRGRIELPVSQASGGTLPGVELNRTADLEDVMSTS
jgi:hypothetical protein